MSSGQDDDCAFVAVVIGGVFGLSFATGLETDLLCDCCVLLPEEEAASDALRAACLC